MIDPKFWNINRQFSLFFIFKYGDNDPIRNCFDKCNRPLMQIKDFNALVDNKLFLIKP